MYIEDGQCGSVVTMILTKAKNGDSNAEEGAEFEVLTAKLDDQRACVEHARQG